MGATHRGCLHATLIILTTAGLSLPNTPLSSLCLFLSRLSFSHPVDAVFVFFPVSCLPIICQQHIIYSHRCSIHTMPTNHCFVCFWPLHFNRDVRIIPDGWGRFRVSSSWRIDSWPMATVVESQPTRGGEIQLEHASMKIHINNFRDAVKLTEACPGSPSNWHAHFYNCATVQQWLVKERTLWHWGGGITKAMH